MSDITLDSSAFYARAKRIFEEWNRANNDPELESLRNIDHILIFAGDADEELGSTKKSVQLQTCLLGYEFPSTIIVFSQPNGKRKITIITSQSKTKILNQLQGGSIDLEILSRPKDAAAALAVLQNYVDGITSSKVTIGNFAKDQMKGKLADDWNKVIKAKDDVITFQDVSPAISVILAPKDPQELKHHLTASRLCSTVMAHYFKPKMESIIDKDSKISHENFAAMIEEKIGNDAKGPDMKVWKKNPALGDVDFSNSDWIYTPIIQSGGKYDLKISAESNADDLKSGVILASMGIKYKEYCSNIARTFLIGPDKSQEANYNFLLDLQQFLLKKMKAGVRAKDVYAAALAYVKEKKPELEASFPKTLGHGTGIDFRDNAWVIGPKNEKTLKENMVFVLYIGFAGLPDPKNKGKTYALLLADTMKVGQETGVLLTDGTKRPHEVILDEGDEGSEEDVKPAKHDKAPKISGNVVGNKVLRAKTRGQGKEVDESKAAVMKQHQSELHAKIQQRGLSKFKHGKEGGSNDQEKVFRKFESYKREDQLPSVAQDLRIHVDEQRSTVILPISGGAVPFHINTIKNVSKTDEGEYTVLRINFQSPGQIVGKKEDTPFEDPNATFVRSATFRSTDARHMSKVADQITNMRKTQNKRETDRRELADVVEQEKLIEVKGRRPQKLSDVQVRPALDNKRNMPGELEIHTNGIRYYSSSGQKVDLLFSNMKHLFFQPCDREMFVILHVHLRAPILINGKKKAKDVQFIREISDTAFDETGNRKRKTRYGDEDEIEQEQEERKRRQMLNKEFQNFAQRISEVAESQNFDFEVDVPFRELGFTGVPFRTSVLLQPTTDCLVHLTEPPFLVITLNEIEVVHLERVQFGLKHFDMVFIFNDFSKPPVHVNSVPMESLDDVKDWLDSVDIPTSEGPVNLSWPAIIKTINDDPYEFYKMGGWNFLTGEGEDEDGEDESSEESAFEASDVDPDSSEDSDDDDQSDFDGDDDDDDEDEVSAAESEEGLDWDEMEKKAEKDDRKRRERGEVESDDDEGGKKKKGGRR